MNRKRTEYLTSKKLEKKKYNNVTNPVRFIISYFKVLCFSVFFAKPRRALDLNFTGRLQEISPDRVSREKENFFPSNKTALNLLSM
jgi:hypothetical protein